MVCNKLQKLRNHVYRSKSVLETEIFVWKNLSIDAKQNFWRLRRYKRRLRDHHRGRAEQPEAQIAQHYVIEPHSDLDDSAPANDQPLIVAEMAASIETLTVGEAVMRMDLSGQLALMFHNSAHGGANMVYVREDGNIGWIDPKGNSGKTG